MNVMETERLLIRHLRASDADALYAICADLEIMRHVGGGHPLSGEQVQR